MYERLGVPAMLAKLNTFTLIGIDAVPVEVEVDAAAGTPKTVLVGLPELAVRESIHRVERALANLGYFRPTGRTVINLAPADLRKDAGAFDLPIALALLVATRQLKPDQLDNCASVGELALDGTVRPVRGALSMAMEARARGVKRLIVPAALRTTHEDHFAAVLDEFVRYFHTPRAVAPWERPNALARYFITTQGVELARLPNPHRPGKGSGTGFA